MTIANFTGDGKEKKAEQLFGCSEAFTGEIRHESLIFLSVFNAFLSITAILLNTLILVSLRKVSSLHPPTKLLLRNLATTGLFVGLISEPLAVVYWTFLMKKHWNICRYAFLLSLITGYLLCGVSLFTVTAMSVDKLLALSLGLRYRQIVTLKRTSVVVALFWLVSIMNSLSAMFVRKNLIVISWISFIAITLCLVTSIVSYTNIFFALRLYQNHVHDLAHQGQTSPLNIARYRKAVSSAMWLQMTLLVCYLPHCVVSGLSGRQGLSPSIPIVRQFTVTLVFLNSTLNPGLYFWRLKEVRQAVKELWRLS